MDDAAPSPRLNRINLICLGVADLALSRAFYRDGLGFETSSDEEHPEIVFFDNAGTKLELFPRDALAADIDANDRCAFALEDPHGLAADGSGCTGDDCELVFQIGHCFS